jgi:hypothetical protein
MENLKLIDSHIADIVKDFRLPENSTIATEKKQLELFLKLKDWQLEVHDFYKNPSFTSEKNKTENNNILINNSGNNLINQK